MAVLLCAGILSFLVTRSGAVSVWMPVPELGPVLGAVDGSEWSYGSGPTGPGNWSKIFPTCGGGSQSPINIDTTGAEVNPSLIPFAFDGWDSQESEEGCTCIATNAGFTVRVGVSTCGAKITGGGLSGTYITSQYHFHWGSDSTTGSEHTIDGQSYPMELHFVHYKQEYRSIQNAVKFPDGLAVLGVLFEVSANDNPDLQNIIDAMPKSGPSAPFDCMPIENLLPSDVSKYYRYHGSLTTPTCNEAVIWTVFPEPIMASEKQLNAFRSLQDTNNAALQNNCRPVQNVNGRTIEVSDD